jgi:hypothetical protein
LIEIFSSGNLSDSAYPVIAEIRRFFEAKALDIQSGGVEHCHSPEWLNIYWPADEYVFIDLVANGKLLAFYEEAAKALRENFSLLAEVMVDAFRLNQALLKLPFQEGEIEIVCSNNVWELYRSVLTTGEPVALRSGQYFYRIDRSTERWVSLADWCEKVVWFCNRSGAYFRGIAPAGPEIAGHY